MGKGYDHGRLVRSGIVCLIIQGLHLNRKSLDWLPEIHVDILYTEHSHNDCQFLVEKVAPCGHNSYILCLNHLNRREDPG